MSFFNYPNQVSLDLTWLYTLKLVTSTPLTIYVKWTQRMFYQSEKSEMFLINDNIPPAFHSRACLKKNAQTYWSLSSDPCIPKSENYVNSRGLCSYFLLSWSLGSRDVSRVLAPMSYASCVFRSQVMRKIISWNHVLFS